MVKIKKQELLSLMKKKERIRDIGIIAHIDHGKTTMSDSLLAAAGIISPKVAGVARALDFLEEEQKRGITIKSANISLLHNVNGQDYVINLVDTPGHVDFTGHVTRALRVIDGAICVVDAVEEVMVQTEVVTRQALEMRVKPVLFVNKMDRLITELKMKPKDIQTKVSRIIRNYNQLIDYYAEPQYRDKWKIRTTAGNFAFGSAIDRWGLTLEIAERKGVKFSDIVAAYEAGDVESLKEEFPLHEAILDMVVNCLPSPIEAQAYRIPVLWRGDLNTEVGQSMVKCDDEGPLVIGVNKAEFDVHAGIVSTGRIFSGNIEEGMEVYLLSAKKKYRVQQVSIYMGARREIVNSISAGNIVAVLGLDLARAGETIVDSYNAGKIPPFERIKYITEPVVTIAIEPKKPQDLPKLIELVRRASIADPNLVYHINEETGETLISGMGELHLEIAIKNLRKEGIDLLTSPPVVVYRETPRSISQVVLAKSPNKHNRFWIQIEPLDEVSLDLLEKNIVTEDMPWKERAKILREKAGWDGKEARNIWAIDEYKNVFIDKTTGVQYLNELKDMIISGFRWAVSEGPLCGEPLRGAKIMLTDAQIHEDPVHRGPAQVLPAIRRAVYGALLSADPTLMEPVYRIQATAPIDLVGKVTGLISKKRGRIERIEEREKMAVVQGYIPVAETIGFASLMRSETGGRVFWQNTFDHWELMPDALSKKVIMDIRSRKGMKKEIPRAEEYMDTL